MFSIFSRKKDPTDEEYERTLADLDGKIRRAERSLSELKQRESRSIADLAFYCAALYVLYLGFYILAVYLPGDRSGYSELTWVGLTFLAIVLPVIMWYFVRFVRWLHRRRQASTMKDLEALRKSQKDTVEELKKRTKFDKTKNLIEKYGGDSGSGTPRRPLSGPNGAQEVGPAAGVPQARDSPVRRGPPPFATPAKPGASPDHASPAKGMEALSPPHMPGGLVSPPNNRVGGPALDPSLRPAGVPPGAPSNPAALVYDTPKAWYDKLFDALIGPAEGPNSKYALICSKCFAHNGLAVAEEFEDIQYYCLRCGHFNSRKKQHQQSAASPTEERRGRSQSATPSLRGFEELGLGQQGGSPVRGDARHSEIAQEADRLPSRRQDRTLSADRGMGLRDDGSDENVDPMDVDPGSPTKAGHGSG
ncbi:hypothetical protein DFJ74DRAFT_327497 [Hyaloraphidium curvatum]|nr:hypothetical protein DFJ74DRAFT_327497 [Hyaloraphidium curvatum]